MIAHIRPPNKTPAPSPLARARQMVAETLLTDPAPRPSLWQQWRKWLLLGGAFVAVAAGGLVYYWFH
jgi:hypothetical protein